MERRYQTVAWKCPLCGKVCRIAITFYSRYGEYSISGVLRHLKVKHGAGKERLLELYDDGVCRFCRAPLLHYDSTPLVKVLMHLRDSPGCLRGWCENAQGSGV